MESENKHNINGLLFEDDYEYKQACKEWDTICNLKKKLPLDNPKAALQLYNQAVSKRTFKTAAGYSFLLELRETIVTNGLVSDDILNPVPIALRQPVAGKIVATDKDIDKLTVKYEGEKKKRIIMTIVITALVAVIAGMFIISMSSKYSIITYFTNYEDNIRNEVINEYEGWKAELDAREAELDAREAGK